MLHHEFVSQPADGVNYLRLFERAMRRTRFEGIDAAVAYATSAGVEELVAVLGGSDVRGWNAMRKRWLVGIDYCRTEPRAIEALAGLWNSEVRIHAGRQVVARAGCTPHLPWHPKLFMLKGPDSVGAICGSGNLSRNGLTRGHEVGSLVLTAGHATTAEQLVWRACAELGVWFSNMWEAGDAHQGLLAAYKRVYESPEHLRCPTPTEDDTAPEPALWTGRAGRRLGAEDLRRLRACTYLWIEAGNVTRNRGRGVPGNQLMLTPMSRVYFGYPADDLRPNTQIGQVSITYCGQTRPDCSLVFSDNSMDKLTLPIPGSGGPPEYDQKNLLFAKRPDGSVVLSVGSGRDKTAWIRRSRAIGADRRMSRSGRQWGVF